MDSKISDLNYSLVCVRTGHNGILHYFGGTFHQYSQVLCHLCGIGDQFSLIVYLLNGVCSAVFLNLLYHFAVGYLELSSQ